MALATGWHFPLGFMRNSGWYANCDLPALLNAMAWSARKAGGLHLLVVDTASLHRHEPGPIWARVCLAIGKQFFPDAGWTEIVVAFACAGSMRSVSSPRKKSQLETVLFMDRPLRGDIKLTSADSVELVLVDVHTPETIRRRSQQKTQVCSETQSRLDNFY